MELAEISNLGDSESNFIFSADGSTNKKCSCSRTWVLVVHNDFLQVEGYERKGNDVDVENLRRVWEHERQCKFAELANCTSAQIIGTLSSGEKLSQLFHPRNSSDPDGILCEPPDVFLLFVLSHGESGGKILTDHLKPKHTEQKNFVLTLETYETCDVWNSLMDVHILESCVKILFFAPCRGLNPELKHDPSNKNFNEAADVPTSGFLSSKPNHEDFIIFYATVETTYSNRNELQGTWFVQSICSVLDSLVESEDILLFFTKVQYHICQRTNSDRFKENIGQTPQLHLFASKQIQFCASHVYLVPLHNKNNLSDCVTKTDCRPNEISETICLHAKDAKRSNFAFELINADRAIFYNWGQEHHRYHRGSALIFHDDPHIFHAISIGESFKNLDFDVKIFSTAKIMTEIGRKSLKKKFKYEGSLALCVFAQLEETNAGLTLKMGKKCVLLSQIVDELSVIKCKNLIGKPKILFIIDEGTKQDNSRRTLEVEELQFSNSNAGICLFVGTRACPDESVTEQLTSMLAMEELKNGQLCLQFALADLIRKITASDNDGNEQSIKPQLISTLPVLVDFPPLLKPYKPFLSTNKCILIAAGITISAIIFALLLSLLTSSTGGDTAIAYFPSNFTQVHLSDNCTVGFSDGNSDQVDAFSYNQSMWKQLSERCNTTWKREYRQEFIAVSLSTSGELESALAQVKSTAPFEKRHVKLVILFGYGTPSDLQHTLKFVSALTTNNSNELLVQSCIDIFHRMESFKQLNGIEMLPFWDIIQKEGLQAELNLTYQLNKSQSVIADKISNYISKRYSNDEYRKLSVAFLKLYDSTKLLFMPQIILTCYRKNLIVRKLFEYIASMGNVACEGLTQVYLLMRTDFKLAGSKKTLILREISAKINEELCKNVTKYLLQLPYWKFQLAFEKFDENGNNLKDLQDKSLNLADDAVFTLIIDNYKGSAKNGTRLAKFIWSLSDREDGLTSRVSTLCLSFELKTFQKLKSLHALVLYSYMSKTKTVHKVSESSIRETIIEYAPSIVQIYLFNRTNCSMNTNSKCLFNAINDTNAILMEHGTSDDANVSYPSQVFFIGFVLHSLEEKALQSDANISKLYIATDDKFKEKFDFLYDVVMKEYFFQNHSQSYIFQSSLSLIKNLNEISFSEYFSYVVFKRAFAQFGLTVANVMITRLDRILARFTLGSMRIFCNFTTALYGEIGSNKSAIYSDEAFAVFIFLENYREHYKNLLKENKSSNEFVKVYINKCSSAFGNLTEGVQGKLDYFLQTWNDPTLQPELLKWHKKFQLSSAWFLPKLVQHVIKNSIQNLLQLLDFFSVLRNESYSEPLGICPGLFELVQQMRLHPNSFDTVIKEKVRQTLPSKYDLKFNFTHITESVSYTSYRTYILKCNQSNDDFFVYFRN